MRPARILTALLFVSGLVGVIVGAGEVYARFLYLSVLLVGVAWIWTQVSLRGVKVGRWARSSRASVGDYFEEHFEVVNDSRLGKLWVELANESDLPNAAGSRLITSLGRRQRRTYIARTWLYRRGGFRLGPTRLTSGDPFGLFRSQREFPTRNSLVVLPMIYELASFISPPGLLPGGQLIRRKALDVTPHAAGVRVYVPGDPMKRIHWPSSARRGQLIVKEFEQDPQAEVWIFLDAQESVHAELPFEDSQKMEDVWMLGRRPTFDLPPSTLEYAVSISASLAHYFTLQRRSVGLVTSGRTLTIIPAERSERQESKILETLAFIRSEGNLALANLVSAQAGQLPQGSSAILVTSTIYPELLLAVDELDRRNLRPVVVLLMAESFGGKTGSEKLYSTLQERNVQVRRIYNGANLSLELSGFSDEIIAKDNVWQRPPLLHLI